MKNLLSIIHLFLRLGEANKKKKKKQKKIRKKDDDDWLWTYTPHGSSLLSFLDIGFISR